MAMSTEENIRHYQRSIDRSNGENGGTLNKTRLLHCIQVLSKLPVTVLHLQTTGIGRTVNALRKIDDGVGDSAKRLVAKWKEMVANTDTSEEEDEACVPDVPECYESPECDSETEEDERAKSNGIQNYEPEALRCSALSPPLDLNIDIGTPESPLHVFDDELDNDEKSKCIDNDSKSKEKSSSSGHSSKSSSKHSSSKDKSSSRKESSSKSSNKDKYKDTNESSKISKSKGSKMNESKNREYSKSTPESSQSSSSKEKKSTENGKRKYESGSSDGESSIKKKKLSESTDGEEDVQSNNIVIDNQSSDEEQHSKDKESSPKDEKHCDKVKTKDKDHHSGSNKSKSHESDDKYKKDKKHSSSKSDKREKEYKHKSDEHRSKESKSKSSQSSSSSSKDCSKNKSKDKDEKCKKEKDVSAKSENEEKVIKDVKDEKEKRKERKEHKESRDSKEQKELKDSKTQKQNKEHKEHTGSKEKKRKSNNDDGIDCNSGTSFADALGMCTTPLPAKKKKETVSSSSSSKPNKMDANLQAQSSKSSPLKSKPDSPNSSEALSLLSPNVKLEPLNQIEDEVDLAVTLPEPSLNYKPLPCKKNSAQLKREEDLMLAEVMYAKNARTKVFSGNKSSGLTKVSSLYDICVRVLTENIDAIEHTGGVPFYILKPIIEQATPDQLFMLEHHNPYLIEDTDYLWQFHCQKDFRTKKQEEMESWREMYMRCFDERETKLKALKANIKQSIDNSTPVRTTKLAYVDNIVKPPRNVLRKQAKFGTADLAAKHDLKKKLISPPTANSGSSASIASTAERISVPPPPTARMRQGTSHTVKKAKAPLMQKALQAIKGRYKR